MMIFPHINGDACITLRPKLNVAAERSIDFPTRAFVRLFMFRSINNILVHQTTHRHIADLMEDLEYEHT